MPLTLALLLGISAALLVWALRHLLVERWERDNAWLEERIWRFTPEPFNPRPYVAGYYAVAIVILLGILLLLPLKLPGVLLWLVLLWVPRWWIDRVWKKRQKAIDDQLAVTIRQMSSSVASGMTLMQAVERLADRAPEPINTEFRVIANYWKLGSDFNAAIEEARRRLALQNFNLFASSILINQRMGGNVTVTLERIAESLEAVDRMRREVHAATAEGRTNIKVLAVAPVVMLAFDAVIDAQAVGWLFTRTVGHALLGLAGALTLGGTLWAWRMVHADV